ncbi:Protein deglycase DJ-1zDJ-1 [Chytridiales sp. JEL 0842]|nr:Protein deglycase DJ-1zDJ-1 [Chytridiales sp. JEL 0842]
MTIKGAAAAGAHASHAGDNAQKTALVLITHGTEELEAISAVDILRRASVHVTLASLAGSGPVECSRGVVVCRDKSLDEVLEAKEKEEGARWWDLLVLPGGLGGARAFEKDHRVQSLIERYLKDNTKWIGAICAAPLALKTHHSAIARRIVSHPSVQRELVDEGGFKAYVGDMKVKVARDGNLITSRGAGTCIEFACELVRALQGEKVLEQVANGLAIPVPPHCN